MNTIRNLHEKWASLFSEFKSNGLDTEAPHFIDHILKPLSRTIGSYINATSLDIKPHGGDSSVVELCFKNEGKEIMSVDVVPLSMSPENKDEVILGLIDYNGVPSNVDLIVEFVPDLDFNVIELPNDTTLPELLPFFNNAHVIKLIRD